MSDKYIKGVTKTCKVCEREQVCTDHERICAQCRFNIAHADDSWRGFLDSTVSRIVATRDDEALPFEHGTIDGEAV